MADEQRFTAEQTEKLAAAEKIVDHHFDRPQLILSAITHPSATEGKSIKYSYERLEFLGDSVLGTIVASEAFHRFPDLNEGGLTRIKVALVSGSSLSEVAEGLGFADVIVFGSSETGTGKRGLHSALENVYEAVVAALYLDAGMDAARAFVERTLIPRMSRDMAFEPENPKSALQEKLQEDGITPTYKLVETQGPPHDRTFVAQVYAGETGLARGTGRTKKEAESQAAQSTLARLGEFLSELLIPDENQKAAKREKEEAARREKEERRAETKRRNEEKQQQKLREREERRQEKKRKQDA